VRTSAQPKPAPDAREALRGAHRPLGLQSEPRPVAVTHRAGKPLEPMPDEDRTGAWGPGTGFVTVGQWMMAVAGLERAQRCDPRADRFGLPRGFFSGSRCPSRGLAGSAPWSIRPRRERLCVHVGLAMRGQTCRRGRDQVVAVMGSSAMTARVRQGSRRPADSGVGAQSRRPPARRRAGGSSFLLFSHASTGEGR